MRFGRHLVENLIPEWEAQYFNYEKCKTLLEQVQFPPSLDFLTGILVQVCEQQKFVSRMGLATNRPRLWMNKKNNRLQVYSVNLSSVTLFVLLDDEVTKVTSFFRKCVQDIITNLLSLSDSVELFSGSFNSHVTQLNPISPQLTAFRFPSDTGVADIVRLRNELRMTESPKANARTWPGNFDDSGFVKAPYELSPALANSAVMGIVSVLRGRSLSMAEIKERKQVPRLRKTFKELYRFTRSSLSTQVSCTLDY